MSLHSNAFYIEAACFGSISIHNCSFHFVIFLSHSQQSAHQPHSQPMRGVPQWWDCEGYPSGGTALHIFASQNSFLFVPSLVLRKFSSHNCIILYFEFSYTFHDLIVISKEMGSVSCRKVVKQSMYLLNETDAQRITRNDAILNVVKLLNCLKFMICSPSAYQFVMKSFLFIMQQGKLAVIMQQGRLAAHIYTYLHTVQQGIPAVIEAVFLSLGFAEISVCSIMLPTLFQAFTNLHSRFIQVICVHSQCRLHHLVTAGFLVFIFWTERMVYAQKHYFVEALIYCSCDYLCSTHARVCFVYRFILLTACYPSLS